MWSAVDEIREGDESSRKANRWAIQGGDKDFRMGVERVCYVKIVGHEGLKPVTRGICVLSRCGFGDRNVCSSWEVLVSSCNQVKFAAHAEKKRPLWC